MPDMMDLAHLKGDDFDKQFLTMMRMHHMSAVEMAQLVPDRATHSGAEDARPEHYQFADSGDPAVPELAQELV